MTDEVAIQRVGQIALLTRDAAAATAFYGTVLGLSHLYTFDTLVFFDCGGTRLFIREVADHEWRPGSIVYLLVADIAAAHRLLVERGVTFEGAPHHIHTHEDTGVEEWMAFFDDPDGNTLSLMAHVLPQSR